MVEILVPIQGVPLKAGAIYIDPTHPEHLRGFVPAEDRLRVDAFYIDDSGSTSGPLVMAPGGGSLEDQLHAARVKLVKLENYLCDLTDRQREELEPIQNGMMLATDTCRKDRLLESYHTLTASYDELWKSSREEQLRLRWEIEWLEQTLGKR